MTFLPYSTENVRKAAIHFLMGRGVAGLAGFATVILLVRFMDVRNYAAYTTLSGLVAMCGVVASLGMERVVSRYVPEARMYRSVDELGRLIWITSAVKLAATLFIVLLVYAFWPNLIGFLSVVEFRIFSASLACFIVGETMFQHFASVLQSLMMQKALTRLYVIQWAGRLLLIAIVLHMKSAIGWQDALWIFAIPEMLGVIGFVTMIKLHLVSLSASEPTKVTSGSWPQWSKVAETGMHNYGFALLAAPPQGYFMKVATAAYLPAETVAAYGFFVSVAEKARQYIPLHFFYGLLEPVMIAGYLKDRNFAALSYRCQLLYKSNLLLMVPVIAWVAAAGEPIVAIMTGDKFHGLSWILVLVMVQLAVGSHVVLLQLLLNSLEESRSLIMASLVALPVMLFAMAVSVHSSVLWLLCAPVLFSLVMNLFIVFRLARAGRAYRPSWKMSGGVLASGLTALASAEMLKTAVTGNVTPVVVAVSTLLAVMTTYFLAAWVLKAIGKSDVDRIKDIILDRRQGGADAVRPGSQSPVMPAPRMEDMWGGKRLVNELQEKARAALDPLIPNGSSVALVDYPKSPNVGDSMIWLGERLYLKSRRVTVRYVCDTRNYRPDRLAEGLGKDTIILMHGGGNFGTLWPEEQRFRLRVLEDFPDAPIIQFPQSIHFGDPSAAEKTARIIRAHANYTLLVRDRLSLDFAAQRFECRAILCPDMAFFIGLVQAASNPSFERFILFRTDHEKSIDWLSELPRMPRDKSFDVGDWVEKSLGERIVGFFERQTEQLRDSIDPHNKLLLVVWDHLAQLRYRKGKGLLEKGRVVISDRLHAHILATLLNKPQVLIDSPNRKISSLHREWTSPYLGVTFANNLQEALAAAADLDQIARRISHEDNS